MTSIRTPDNTGSAPPRLATARPADPRASTSTSRSHRNFTVGPSLVVVLREKYGRSGSKGCGLWMTWHVPRSSGLRSSRRCPQDRTDRCGQRGPSVDDHHLIHRNHIVPTQDWPSSSRTDTLDQIGDLVVDLPALFHQGRDLLDRVDHRGVVPTAELLGD